MVIIYFGFSNPCHSSSHSCSSLLYLHLDLVARRIEVVLETLLNSLIFDLSHFCSFSLISFLSVGMKSTVPHMYRESALRNHTQMQLTFRSGGAKVDDHFLDTIVWYRKF
jgi:hypothetical protein